MLNLTRASSWLSVAALALLVAAGTLPARAQSEAPVLRVGAVTTDSYAQAMYAQAAGIFKSAGLNVAITLLPNTGAISAALAGGSIDIGIGSALSVAGGREAGIPFYVIAPGGEFVARTPTTVLMVAKSSPLRSAKDLEGKTVGADNIRGITETAMRSWLLKNGADPSKVQYVEMPFTTMGPALTRGTVDAALIAEPALASARSVAREFGNPMSAIADEWYISVWFTTGPWLAKNDATAHAFASAIDKASVWANTHHAETAPILQKYLPVSDDVLAKMTRARFGERLDPRVMQPVLDAGFKSGVLKSAESARELIAAGF